MKVDRVLALIGVMATLIGVAVTWYSLKSDPSVALLTSSGWIAALIVGSTLSYVAIKLSNLLDKFHAKNVTLAEEVQTEKARADKHENLSNALATMIAEPLTPAEPVKMRRSQSGGEDV